MNKFLQKALIILFPFYPLWAWLSYITTNVPVSMFVNILFAPIAFDFIMRSRKSLPKYLILFICFTIYHLYSIFYNNLIQIFSSNWFSLILSDSNVLACSILIISENIVFEERLFKKLNRCLYLSVIVTLVVSLIQLKYVDFFVSPEIANVDENLVYLEQHRNFSFYTWANQNSLGITFPIFVSLLLGVQNLNKGKHIIASLSGIIVAFLSRAKYLMISILVVLSQVLISQQRKLKKRFYILIGFLIGIISLMGIANSLGYNIKDVINERILEKNIENSSAKARIISYNVFLLKFPEHPWLGVGPNTRNDVKELLGEGIPLIHVGYLSYLYYYGVVGSLLFFLSLFYLMRKAWIVGKKNNFWGSFYGLLSLCFANLTFVYFNFSEAGIVMAVIYIKYFEACQLQN